MALLRQLPLLAFMSLWSLSLTHLVRIARVAAAMKSIASGPPMLTGAPSGTDMHKLVGRLMGKLHDITNELSLGSEPHPHPPDFA
jgi:hypothetical protein